MYDLQISWQANNDLENIIAYIANKLVNPSAASAFSDAVYDCCQQLRRAPYIYGECADARLKAQGYRRAVIKKYVMIYKDDDAAKAAIVLRFFYGARNYGRLL